MTHWKLGDRDEARQCYDRALPVLQGLESREVPARDRVFAEDLRRLRSEAEEVLQLKKK
jgi:hypothetical protein